MKKIALPGASRAIVACIPRVNPLGPSVFSRCCKHCRGPLYWWLLLLFPSCRRHCTTSKLFNSAYLEHAEFVHACCTSGAWLFCIYIFAMDWMHACCTSAFMLHACCIPNTCVLTSCVILCTFPACSSKVLQQANDCFQMSYTKVWTAIVLNNCFSVAWLCHVVI